MLNYFLISNESSLVRETKIDEGGEKDDKSNSSKI